MRSRVRPVECGRRGRWPNCSARVGSQTKSALGSALTLCGLSRSPERPYPLSSCRRQLVLSVYLHAALMLPAMASAPVSVAMDDDRPGHPRNLVGQCEGRDLGRSTRHQSSEPWPLQRAVLLRVADNGHRADDEQPSQVSVTLLGDAAELVLAAGRLLLGYQANPRSQATTRPECLPVADLGNQGSGDDRTNAWNLFQPPDFASLERCQARIVLSIDPISAPRALYCRASTSSTPRATGGTRLSSASAMISSKAPVPLRPSPTRCRVRPDARVWRVAQHRALTHQQLSGPVQQQGSLLLLRLDRNKPHRWPRHRLTDRRCIVRIILAALEIGLHVAWRHQLHRVARACSSRPQ